MMMKHIDYSRLLTQARLLHSDLRSCSRLPEDEAERLALYRAVRKHLDIFYAIADHTERREPTGAARELILDAMYHIGTSENGFLEAEGLDHRYGLLLEAVKDASNLL